MYSPLPTKTKELVRVEKCFKVVKLLLMHSVLPLWPPGTLCRDVDILKLDGVGPIDNRPSTDKLHHFVQKKRRKRKRRKKMWHVTCDAWHVTRDMWHVTRDMWHVTCDTFGGVNILSKFQLPSSYCLWFMMLWRSGGKGWVTELMNDEAVYRTAPATPGLLIIVF